MEKVTFVGLFLLTLASAAPPPGPPCSHKENCPVIATPNTFSSNLTIYKAEHDVIKIVVPLNRLNKKSRLIFFVEDNDNGLYVKKDKEVRKLLENGRDATYSKDVISNDAYFAAKDGIYYYNATSNEAVKFGTVDEDLIAIEATNNSDKLYVLTSNKVLYQVTEEGTKKVKVDDVKNAEQIVVDFANNLFYVDSEKKVFVMNNDGVKQVKGFKDDISEITIIRPPYFLSDGGIPAVVDRTSYIIQPSATIENQNFTITADVNITAYSVETGIIHYYATGKTIYEYDLVDRIVKNIYQKLSSDISSITADLQKIIYKILEE